MSKAGVLLPVTRFPARIAAALRSQHDLEIQKNSKFADLYKWQKENLKNPAFILHDGPPYANGDLHMGHALNKISKDIINRHHILNGRQVNYVPGWDCHGLPIELKAMNYEKQGEALKKLNPFQLRNIAKKFALLSAEKQLQGFKSWGVMADWDRDIYYTIDKGYIQNQLRQFYNLYTKKLIYRDVKPVYWSPSSGTALAEAELEYDQLHKSTEIYLKLKLDSMPNVVKDIIKDNKVYAVIWTTTPWSLVGNQAVCYSPNLKYSLVKDEQSYLIIASPLIQQLEKILNRNLEELCTIQGSELSNTTYYHPLKNITLPFLAADHVSSEKGTGLVHTAPAHGPEDFLVALKHNIKIECHVDEQGKFVNTTDWLNGLYVLDNGQNEIIKHLSDDLLYTGTFIHSYPLDWRTKKPVIIRASSQWFIDTNSIREKALEALDKVNILPTTSSNQYREIFMRQLQNRPYWCISRQRLWGNAIPVVYHDDKPLINKDLVENVCKMLSECGPDSWWMNPLEDFVPESLLIENNVTIDQLERGKDIMDIWLDSGLSWSYILNRRKADLYLEGLDQFTGWFQSSLLTSVALTGSAPYKNIFVHGFTVDSNGRKMSKSLGNVIDPETIIKGGKNLQKEPAFGIDALRWWVAMHGTQHSQVVINNNILKESLDEISKIRLILKYLLGCMHDLKISHIDESKEYGYLDSYMLHLLYKFNIEQNSFYDQMQLNKVCSSTLYFTTNQISGFYCHAIKDRLYCDKVDSLRRRNAQSVMHHIFMNLLKAVGPIVPHLAEEAWSYHPFYDKNVPYFQINKECIKPIWERIYVEDLMDTVLCIKKELNKLCSGSNTLEYGVKIRANPELFDKLSLMQKFEVADEGDLCDILHVSRVQLEEGKAYEDEWVLSVDKVGKMLCNRCRRYTSNEADKPCERCKEVITDMVQDKENSVSVN